MKQLNITVTNANANNTTVKSEAAMWNYLRQVRDGLTDENLAAGARAVVTDTEGNIFKDITFKRNSKGKIEMPNAVKETCRRQVEKAKAAAKALAEKEEARRARKREADRRYRERKKAERLAAAAAVNTTDPVAVEA